MAVGSNEAISKALNISTSTIERVRQRFVESGIDAACLLSSGARTQTETFRWRKRSIFKARSLFCEPPQGQGRWTWRLLADKMVELDYVESLCHETVRQTLKKMNFSRSEKSVG